MKSAVSARSAFALHHSAYSIALKNTGAALNDFGHGEVHDHQSDAPPLPVDSLLRPPPPLPPMPPPPPPLLRAVSMPEFVIPKPQSKPGDTIQEEDDEEDAEDSLHRRGGGGGGRIVEEDVEVVGVPPLPPSPPRPPPTNPIPPPPPETKETAWDYFFEPAHNLTNQSEDINRYDTTPTTTTTTTTSESDDRKYSDNTPTPRTPRDRLKRTEKIDVADVASTSGSKVETRAVPQKVIEPEAMKPVKKLAKQVPVVTQQVPAESKTGGSVASSHVSLTQILNELDDKFLKAYQSAYEVSKLLEANRMHYHSNFADNRGHIDHSARLMRVITWNRSIKGLQNANDAIDDDYDTHESLASVLDKLLAWEKKLYDEVKVGELMKIEYQRKVAVLNKRQKQGTHSEALEKAKAAVGHLHTRYIVDMQSMDSTVSEIAHLRDDHLYPKLVSLVDGMARMWETMNAQHRGQMKIVEDLRSLDISDTPYETTGDHHQRTIQLYGAVDDWHQHFSKLMSNQKNYVIALNSWLKLNLIPIESNIKEKVSSPLRVQRPPIQALLQVWHENLERLPNELARSAISSFAAIMENIRVLQEDEVNMKMKCEKMRKDLSREQREYEDFLHKYNERMAATDGIGQEDVNRKDPIGERQMKLELLNQRLKDEEEAHEKHCRHVREKSLATLKSHLPELFRAMSEFAYAASGMYKKLVPLTQPPKQNESSS